MSFYSQVKPQTVTRSFNVEYLEEFFDKTNILIKYATIRTLCQCLSRTYYVCLLCLSLMLCMQVASVFIESLRWYFKPPSICQMHQVKEFLNSTWHHEGRRSQITPNRINMSQDSLRVLLHLSVALYPLCISTESQKAELHHVSSCYQVAARDNHC